VSGDPQQPEATRRYRLLEPIGSGGFGTVHRGELIGAATFRKTVAIKLLDDEDPKWLRRLRDEARLLGLIRHRAIVGVDDLVRIEGRWALVMEFIDGQDLAALLRAGPLPPRAAVDVAQEVALALAQAHRAVEPGTGQPLGLVHRDIKPANIRITPAGEVKVLDFGIAKAEFDGRESATRSMTLGTLRYMSPERFEGESTGAADVFALGIVLWECLVGEPMERLPVMASRFDAARQRALARLPPLPLALAELLASMLAYEPAERPTAQEVAGLLSGLRGALWGAWLFEWAPEAVSRWTPPEAPPSSAETLAAPEPVDEPAVAQPARRGLVAGVLAGLGLVIAVGVGSRLLPTAAVEERPPEPAAEAPVAPDEAPDEAPVAIERAAPEPAGEEGADEVVAAEVEAAPTTPAPPPQGTVTLRGKLDQALLADAARGTFAFSPPTGEGRAARVPAGVYRLQVRFRADGGWIQVPETVTVTAGATRAVTCSSRSGVCRIQ